MNDVYLIDGARTPFLKATGDAGPFSASDLAVSAAEQLFLKYPASLKQTLDEIILGCMMPSPDEANIARIVGLRLGCNEKIPAYTVQRNCASGMQALDSAWMQIALGRSHLVLAGGSEAMSRAPLLFNDSMTAWFARMMKAKSGFSKLKNLFTLRPKDFKPVIALLRGLTDSTINLSMGQTAEILAEQFSISRKAMDEFALASHTRALQGQEKHHFEEIITLFSKKGDFYGSDNGVRKDSTLEKLAQLKPIFDKPFGSVTAGNSSQVTDGAAVLLLASEKAVQDLKLPILAKIKGTAWAGVLPREMGLGPAHAIQKLIKQFNLNLKEVDYFEINEAFSAQVLACVQALQSDAYCHTHFDLKQAVGAIPLDRLNVDGGAIALGHPVGASGARIVLHLAHILKRTQAKHGIASLCIGGGQGGAMLLEGQHT